MGTVRFKAGVLSRDSQWFGAATILSSEVFEADKMDKVQFGWLTPALDNGIGSPSLVNSFQESSYAPASNSVAGIDFFYNHSVNIRRRYFISALSSDYTTAFGTASTNPNYYTVLSPISPYTLLV